MIEVHFIHLMGVLWEHNYKTDVQQVWSYQVHANKESVSTFSLDKLEKIHRSYKVEIKIRLYSIIY